MDGRCYWVSSHCFLSSPQPCILSTQTSTFHLQHGPPLGLQTLTPTPQHLQEQRKREPWALPLLTYSGEVLPPGLSSILICGT